MDIPNIIQIEVSVLNEFKSYTHQITCNLTKSPEPIEARCSKPQYEHLKGGTHAGEV